MVRPPAYRFDVKIEADLIEELIRLRGYEALQAGRPRLALQPVAVPEMTLSQSSIRRLLVERGYHEAITYSFVDPALQAPFLADATPIDLLNPIASDLSQMRTSLWPGLVRALQGNLKRQKGRVRLFEIGAVFAREAGDIRQEIASPAWSTGHRCPSNGVATMQAAVPIFSRSRVISRRLRS